jgi:hypothetical protein
MAFVVFEDMNWAVGPAVHRDTCRHFVGRKLSATTVRWREGFKNYAAAVAHARGIERPPRYPARPDPGCCRPSEG